MSVSFVNLVLLMRITAMNRTIIDFVSFSGSPELLQRCKEMAKQRFAIAQTNEFQSQNVVAVAHREKTQIAYFMENLAQALGCDERNEFANSDLYFAAADKELKDAELEIATDKTFKECYDNLISNIGIDMLDVLCHGEIESFLEVLQNEMRVITGKSNAKAVDSLVILIRLSCFVTVLRQV